jgi:hypothetical protein
MREFPPRLPHQPIFYPVVTMEYATQIARDWNTQDEGSGFAGFVTQFTLMPSCLRDFRPHTVCSSSHVEYWIPAEQLPEFNASIQGSISVEAAYFGKAFKGCVPERFGLQDKDAVQQFLALSTTWNYSRMDFVCEVSANRKAMFLNLLFWAQFDFTPFGINQQQRDATIGRLKEAWAFNHIEVPLPSPAHDS